jgi:cytochrome c peroxidase
MKAQGFVLAMVALVVGCSLDSGAEEGEDVDDEDESTLELASHVTIPRVPNPPLASDLVSLPGDLRAIAVPQPPDLATYVVDRRAAIALGKALFWDMQVGSDNIQACGTCHFHGGADPRSKNQVSPGLKAVPHPDVNFTTGGPNYQLRKRDFPLTRLAVPGQRGELDPTRDSNDAVASQGIHHTRRHELDPDGFNVDDVNTRRVEPRNTPTTINAVFNHRQFWDGRAEAVFNGVNHRGNRDPNARVARALDRSKPELVRIAIANGSLASQAVVPVVSTFEMASPGRSLIDVATKLLPRRPLALQQVHRRDSVLGPLSRAPRRGLAVDNYAQLIRQAFQRTWWDSAKLVQIAADGSVRFVDRRDGDPRTREVSMMAYNFGLFFGLSIQLYEATLVSDDSPWDRFRRQHPSPTDPALNPWTNEKPDHITRTALFGAMLFNDRTRGPTNLRCSNCHEGAELTDASVRRVAAAPNGPVRNRDGNIIDKGFNNIGLRPTSDDLGVGASDELGPLSHARRLFPDAPPATFDGAAVTKGVAVQGAFKIPSLRNVELTAPYFHNGDARTLRQAVELYSRGGNVAPITTLEGVAVEPLGVPTLTRDEVTALVAYLRSLTDERVRYRRAPFDHPQIFVPDGHRGDDKRAKDRNRDDRADDRLVEINAVGAEGGAEIPGFLEGKLGRDCDDDDHRRLADAITDADVAGDEDDDLGDD